MTNTRSMYNLAHPTTGKTWLSNDEIVDVRAKDTDNPGYGFIRTWPRSYGDSLYTVRYFQNSVYGINMNVNGLSDSDNFEYVNDGNDHVYWLREVIVGDEGDFLYSTAQNHTPGGTSSLSTIPSENGDVLQLRRTAGLISTEGYATFEFWVWVDQWTTGVSEINMYFWNTSTDMQVGGILPMGDYINTEDTGQWQKGTVILDHSQELTFDAIRFAIIGVDNKADIYMDDIVFREFGGTNPAVFDLRRDSSDEILLVDKFHLSFGSSTYNQFWDGSSQVVNIYNLDYTKILDISLANGLFYIRTSYGVTGSSATWKNLANFLRLPGFKISNFICSPSSGGFLTVTGEFNTPLILHDEADGISISISDDLTVFDYFVFSTECRIANRP